MSIPSRLLRLCPKSSGASAPAGPAAPVPPRQGTAGHPVRRTSEILDQLERYVHPSMPLLAAEVRDRSAQFKAEGD